MIVIYTITNIKNQRQYVGCTCQYDKRIKRHINEIHNKNHHNINIKNDSAIYSINDFRFDIIYTLNDKEDRYKVEQFYIDFIKPYYNIGDAKFGDCLSKHPNKDNILNKIKNTILDKYSKMSKEDKIKKFAKYGKDNPNWKGVYNYCKYCGNKINKIAKVCSKCRNRSGKNNPFYGKKHNKETINKLKMANTGRTPVNIKTVYAEGNIFESLQKAADYYNITTGAIYYRVHNKSEKWKNFYYINK